MYLYLASLVAQLVKNPPATQMDLGSSLDWEDPLEKGKATYASILAWRIPWTIQSMGSISWTRLSFFDLADNHSAGMLARSATEREAPKTSA